jgi:hypothetical protein
MIDPKLEEAFTAYIRSEYAGKFSLRNGETTKLVVSKLSIEEVGDAWNEFVKDMKKYLGENT